jgi:hypothetical protein
MLNASAYIGIFLFKNKQVKAPFDEADTPDACRVMKPMAGRITAVTEKT